MYDRERFKSEPRPVSRDADRPMPYPETRMQTWAELEWERRRADPFGGYARQIEADVLRSMVR